MEKREKDIIILKNIKINKDLIEKVEELEAKVSKFNEKKEAKYALSHPLSNIRCFFYNR